MEQKYYIKKIVNHDAELENQVIIIRDGTIADIKPWDSTEPETVCPYAIPGFIDIHTHGGGGHDLMDNSAGVLNALGRFHLANGTTSFLASTLTAGLSQIESVLSTVSGFMDVNESEAAGGRQARLLGIHLEGPWLSGKNIGAQNPDLCITPGEESFRLIRKYRDLIRMVTFSYDSPQSEKFLELLTGLKIIPACGHDDSWDDMILSGFEKGIQVITHIYCVSSTSHKRNGLRHLGTTEMGLMKEGIKVEVIADGKHITRHYWDFIRHNKTPEDILVITDSIRCAGLALKPGSKYSLGGQSIIIDDGVAWLEDKSVFAGSVATMHSNFKRIVKEWKAEMSEAVKITSRNQALLLNISDKLGEISPGKIADILLLDHDLNLVKVIKSGFEVKK